MKILSLFPFLVSSLCPCNFKENGIQFEFTGFDVIDININSETRWRHYIRNSFPNATFFTLKLWSTELGLVSGIWKTDKLTESDCMIFNVFGKVNFYLTFGSGI